MRLRLLLLVAPLAAPLPTAAAQDAPKRPAEDALDTRSDAKDIEGCWRLTAITLDGLPDDGARGAGVLLIDGPHIAFEMHRTWSGARLEHRMHQSYLGDYRIVDGDELHVRRYIGSYLDDVTGELDWISAGETLWYRFRVEDERLVLEFNQRDRMVFSRLTSSLPGERDVFGRVREGSVNSNVDIFGRKRASSGDDEETEEDGDAPSGRRDLLGRLRDPEDELRAPHVGCWRMNAIQLDDLPRNGDKGPGYLLLTKHFAVLAVHKTWEERGQPFDVHQTFIAEYRIVDDSTLQTRSINGSRLDPVSGQLLFEGAGPEREYQLLDGRNTLSLRFGSDNSMSFTRHAQRGNRGTDIFGRDTGERGAPDDVDIFGRKRKKK